ncbi:LamG-like jellyroll fold domain-containing protein [Luteolibacter sp. LG18]|uniref:LamG-like jellyroll fold domain-containing protein n=1 Tax=Luteolibacter sp. LG18 TaxID=2819286 RepID=UPI002B29E745|nr:hypothetical protein llg_02920 [Luteolibacter sp. LG18]
MKTLRLLSSWIVLLAAVSPASAGMISRYGFDDAANPGANSGSAAIGWSAFSGVTRSATHKFGGGSGSFVRGTSQAVTGSLSGTAARTNRFTLSMHVYANMGSSTLDSWPDFVSIGNPSGYARFVIEATGPGGGIALYKFSSATATDGYALGTITSNAWHHLGIVADGVSVTLYVDGVASGSPIPHTASEAISAVTLASRYGSTSRGITTLLDDVAFFDEALDAKQMAWLAWNPGQAEVPRYTSYADWALQIPYASRRGGWVDQDGDGATNLAEYFFGTSPVAAGGMSSAAAGASAGGMVVRWLQLESGAGYQLERSSALQGDWTPVGDVTPSRDLETSAPLGYLAMKAEVPLDTGRGFFRVRASAVAAPGAPVASEVPDLPSTAEAVMMEDWSSGGVDAGRWYIPRKMWGQGNNGVTPANVRVEDDSVWGANRPVLVCQANGDLYDGAVTGYGGAKSRVGGMVVTRAFHASGRYEVDMKIGGTAALAGGPADPMRPAGAIPAVWVYGYRYVAVSSNVDSFHPETPLYNPLMKVYGTANEYWSEIDFPEFGQAGNFDNGLYNTFLQTKNQTRTFSVTPMIDGQYHTLTTDWHTTLVPIAGVTDAQVIESGGFYWVQDKAIGFNSYYGNPLKRLGPNSYAVYMGSRADHYLDGKKVAENLLYVPSMAAQLTLGVWLPGWGGAATWKQSTVSFSGVRIWQFHDPGDVRGVITANITNNY